MKRLRSSEDLDSLGEKSVPKDPNPNPNRPISSHRSFYYKSDNARKGFVSSSSSSSRYDRDRSVEDDREGGSRVTRKRSEPDFDRRKGFERHRDGSRGGVDRPMQRSESFCGPRRDFPKGFRSERDRPRREGSVSSWRRFGDEAGRGRGLETASVSVSVSARSPKGGLRDVKSPTWSKDSGSEQSRAVRSPKGFRDVKSKSRSPTWSGSEQSRSLEVSKAVEVSKTVEVDKGSDVSKSVDVPESLEVSKAEQAKEEQVEVEEEMVVGGGDSSEMEEGEFEPEPELPPQVGVGSEGQDHVGMDSDMREVESRCRDEDAGMEDGGKPLAEDEREMNGGNFLEKENVVKDVDGLPSRQNDPNDRMSGRGDTNDTVGGEDEGSKKGECSRGSGDSEEDVSKAPVVEESPHLEKEDNQDYGINLEVKAEEMELMESNMNVGRGRLSNVNLATATGNLSLNFKDKGKHVAIAESATDVVWVPRESRDALTTADNDTEGPSSRGFELFSTSPVRKLEKPSSSENKQKEEKLGMESLDLCLSLPNVLLPIGARERNSAPGSPTQARSVQSLTNTFCTNSDGFTASMSFSGSQSFFHNPSCSLTNNSIDNHEQSVHSRPLFQGVEWQVLAQNESKQKEVLQRIMMNGNGSHAQSQSLQGNSNSQALQSRHPRVPEGSSKMPSGLERQLSFQKQPSGQRHHEDVKSLAQSVGSHEIGSNSSFDKKRAMRENQSRSTLYRSSSQKEQQFQAGGADFVETIIARILSEPIHTMARKFHEMAGQSVACLKENIRDVMLNPDKCAQLFAFQRALQNRSDITLEMLLKSHRAQLEILVALKTGISDFLQHDNGRPSSELAEIFLNTRCRNLTCRSLLPVDECDCKVCVQKNGFCSACMCLVCSKFDMASNTCSWVGCDVCLHWCHADCGLQKSYIRNGHSATGAQGTTEMQFHCVACDHPSEMFGFVKEVFLNFAKEWSAETFSKELEYVKRIFSGSKDIRGRQMYQIADQLLIRLANKSEVCEVYNHIMAFLKDSSKLAKVSVSSGKEHGRGGIAGPSQESPWLKSVYSEKGPLLERNASALPSFNYDRSDKRPIEPELHRSASQKEPIFDELESIVRIKQAEAKMFQARADDARREAEGLKRIAIAKSEKIEEEFKTRIAKLRLVETEDLRKQKLEDLQGLERAHREYFNMKMRMESDIKDLLLKMEATKRNLAM